MDKKGKINILMVGGFIFLIILGIILGVASSQIYENYKRENIPSQCYTNLQPSKSLGGWSYQLSENQLIVKYVETGKITVISVADTGSMRPTISNEGAILLMRNLDKNDIKVGDIISIDRLNKVSLLHRVIEITEEGYITKGDNNANPDKTVWQFEQIGGKVVGIIY